MSYTLNPTSNLTGLKSLLNNQGTIMTRLTKAIKTDIKDLIRDKAINPKELALEAKKRDFLLKAFWGQISKHEYQAWKMLPKVIYENTTFITYSLQVRDIALGSLSTSYNKIIPYPRNMHTYLSYEKLPKHLQQEFKELIKEVDAHNAYVAEVMTNLDVTLNSCSTVKKLRELWVNGAEIIDKALGQSQQSPTVFMPMVAIQTLDALVPLP